MGTEHLQFRDRYEESRLIDRCRGGDAKAWDELFDRHYAATARFAAQASPDLTPEDIEEVCQEVFLSVVRNLGSFHGGSRLQTWIFRMAINQAHDHRQRHAAAKRGGGRRPLSLHEPDPETGLTLDPADTGPAPDLALLRSEHLDLVGRAVAQLSDRYREVVELRYFADLSYEEIARALGLNPKTVSSRLSKSLDRLARLLQTLPACQTNPEVRCFVGARCS
jgi:RNA polymerase sigma-70 factor (ECF subfamily)